jgi:flagellar hook-basal body complex protein FliE
MAINPVSGIGPIQGPAAPAGLQKPAAADSNSDFGKTLRQALDNVNDSQNASTVAIEDFVTGRNQDVLPVVNAVAKADLSFKLLVGVRNKVSEAYKQTMNMQI